MNTSGSSSLSLSISITCESERDMPCACDDEPPSVWPMPPPNAFELDELDALGWPCCRALPLGAPNDPKRPFEVETISMPSEDGGACMVKRRGGEGLESAPAHARASAFPGTDHVSMTRCGFAALKKEGTPRMFPRNPNCYQSTPSSIAWSTGDTPTSDVHSAASEIEVVLESGFVSCDHER